MAIRSQLIGKGIIDASHFSQKRNIERIYYPVTDQHPQMSVGIVVSNPVVGYNLSAHRVEEQCYW